MKEDNNGKVMKFAEFLDTIEKLKTAVEINVVTGPTLMAQIPEWLNGGCTQIDTFVEITRKKLESDEWINYFINLKPTDPFYGLFNSMGQGFANLWVKVCDLEQKLILNGVIDD